MGWRDHVKHLLRHAGYDLTRFPLPGYLRRYQVDVVLDIGANEGGYAEMLRKYGYRGRIVSFEPQDSIFGTLQQKAAADPLWEALNLALGGDEGEGIINISGKHASSSILEMLPRSQELVTDIGYVGTQPIKIVPLDAVIGDHTSSTDRIFLKIDTQGFEREVLEGATQSLDRILGVQVEMALVELYKGETLMPGIVNLLMQRGFSLMWLEPGFKDPQTLQLLQVDGIFFR